MKTPYRIAFSLSGAAILTFGISLLVIGIYLPHETAFRMDMENAGAELSLWSVCRIHVADIVTAYWYLGALFLFLITSSIMLFRSTSWQAQTYDAESS